MQIAVIEFAQRRGLANANSTEFDADTPHPVVALITEWQNKDGKVESAMPIRIWAAPCVWLAALHRAPETLAHRIYQNDAVAERHRHRYEVNNHYVPRLEASGMIISARTNAESPARNGRELDAVPASASVVLRLPVPPEFTSHPARRPPAVHLFHQGRFGASQDRTRRTGLRVLQGAKSA